MIWQSKRANEKRWPLLKFLPSWYTRSSQQRTAGSLLIPESTSLALLVPWYAMPVMNEWVRVAQQLRNSWSRTLIFRRNEHFIANMPRPCWHWRWSAVFQKKTFLRSIVTRFTWVKSEQLGLEEFARRQSYFSAKLCEIYP